MEQMMYAKSTIDIKEESGGIPMHTTVFAIFISSVKQTQKVEGLQGIADNHT